MPRDRGALDRRLAPIRGTWRGASTALAPPEHGGRLTRRLITFLALILLGLSLAVPAGAGVEVGPVSESIDATTAARACSFTATTGILLADGTTKDIEDVEVGDEVLATDPETGETLAREVTHVFVHQDTVIDLIVEDGAIVTTTEDHPFWNATDSEFQAAAELDAGDQILTADGDTLTVEGLDRTTARTATAYNLAIDDIHTYYVEVGADEALVHNTCPVPGSAAGGLSDDVARLSEANITSSGDTVLGSYPGYIAKARDRGASYFDIGDTWRSLPPGQRTAANEHFLDVVAGRGDRILLSTPKTQIQSGTSLADEITHLRNNKGYVWVNQWSLRPPG